MDTAILDLNDCQLRLWKGGEMLLQSPGYALLQNKQYVFGEVAHAQARLRPRDINHRYWWQLDTEPMQPAFGPGRHTADLVHAHLLQIYEMAQQPAEIILAVPASMQTEQLSLLLGIIGQCPFDAVGLVDRAVASCCTLPLGPESCHIELQLHQALVTHLKLENGDLQRSSATPVPGCGLLAIQDRMAKSIADGFIRQTRFDPRRQAATEQQLYDALPGLLQSLRDEGEHNLELGGHRARIERDTLANSCQDIWQRIAQAANKQGQQVILEPFLALLPGVESHLSRVQVLEPDALSRGLARHHAALQGDESGLHFVSRLPADSAPETAPEVAPAAVSGAVPAEKVPQAEPGAEPSCYRLEITDGACVLHPLSGPGPRLNGETVNQPRQLRHGDCLDLGNGEILTLEAAVKDRGP